MNAKREILVPCSRCDGFGVVELPEELARTVGVLRRGPISAPELHRLLSVDGARVTATASNNRLEDLRRLGLAVRRKTGKRWIYTLTEWARVGGRATAAHAVGESKP